MSRAHRRPKEAWKGRKSRRYRLQGLDQGCWRLGSHMGCREACRERERKKKVFLTVASEVPERQKHIDTLDLEEQTEF